MTQDEVVSLMSSSKSENEWNQNCDQVKASFNGQYPDFWYFAIILGGVHKKNKGRARMVINSPKNQF